MSTDLSSKNKSEYTLFVQRIGLSTITQGLFSLKGIIILPILTKTLGASDYGIWAQVLVTVTLLRPVVTLGLGHATVRFLSSKGKNEINQGIFTVFSILLLVSVSAWSADKYELRYASEYPDKHPTVRNAILPWMEEVKKLSGGRLEIHFFNPNALAPARKVYDALVAGSIDMTGSPCHWVHGKFPLNTGIQNPLIFNGAEAGSLTVWDMYNKYPDYPQRPRQAR